MKQDAQFLNSRMLPEYKYISIDKQSDLTTLNKQQKNFALSNIATLVPHSTYIKWYYVIQRYVNY